MNTIYKFVGNYSSGVDRIREEEGGKKAAGVI
jgi:hypothetical protein